MFSTLFKFDPGQPRDKVGRWTTANPGSGMYYDMEQKEWVHPTRTVSVEDKTRLREAKMPVVYTDVRVNPDKNSDLIAVGTDTSGTRQYKYSAAHSEKHDPEKHARVRDYGAVRPSVNRKALNIMQDESQPQRRRDTAAVLVLVHDTAIRNGGASMRDAIGATTLEAQHLVDTGKGVRLQFTGKHGVSQNLKVTRDDLVSYLRGRAQGKRPSESLFDTSDQSTRDMLHELSGNPNFKVHDMRTWMGTAVALKAVKGMDAPTNKKEFVRYRNQVAAKVAKVLGNNQAAALKAYIDPMVFKEWEHAQFINPSKTRKVDDDYDLAELDALMEKFLSSISFDVEPDWINDADTDFDPDDNTDDERKLRNMEGYGDPVRSGTGAGPSMFLHTQDDLIR